MHAAPPTAMSGQARACLDACTVSGGHIFVHERLGLGVLQAEIQFVGGRAPVQRRDDEPGELACPVDRRRFPAVLQQGNDVIVRARARAGRSRRRARKSSGTRRHRSGGPRRRRQPIASPSRATLARKLVPRSSTGAQSSVRSGVRPGLQAPMSCPPCLQRASASPSRHELARPLGNDTSLQNRSHRDKWTHDQSPHSD